MTWMMKYLFRTIIPLVFLLVLSSCSSTIIPISERRAVVDALAESVNFEKRLVDGGDFVLTTYQRISDSKMPYVFYLEGDGTIVSGDIITDNPTPRENMLIKLASIDDRPNVIYIARPCQYTELERNEQCNHSKYWTSHRMSEEVISSINKVINTISNGSKFSLVGFSGGGGVAVLIAQRNKNVADIITIAGNLDHIAFTTNLHLTSKIFGSLNPIDYAKSVNHIPQLHLSGSEDRRVPSFIAEKFVKASNSKCVIHKVIKNNTHMKGWQDVWANLYRFDFSKLCQTTENMQ